MVNCATIFHRCLSEVKEVSNVKEIVFLNAA